MQPEPRSIGTEPAPPKRDHERRDVDVWTIIWIAALLVITAIVVQLAMVALFRRFDETPRPADDTIAASRVQSSAPFPAPRLQTAPQEDLKAYMAREEAEMNSYGWIDRSKGVVQIPVARAMDLIVQNGLPRVSGSAAALTPLQSIQNRPLWHTPEP
jgi:hypothetical protein